MGPGVPQFAYLESEQDERRNSPRKKLRLNTSGATASDQAQVVVHDISETGLLLESPLKLARGEELDVLLPDLGTRPVTVAWASGQFFGCEFVEVVPADAADEGTGRGLDARPEKGSPEAIARASYQLEELSQAIARMSSVLDRAIHQLSKRER